MQEPLSNPGPAGVKSQMMASFNRMPRDERLYALALCLSGKPHAYLGPELRMV